MPKRIDFTLNEQQATELGEAIKHDKRPEVRQRALAIRLLSRQEPPKEVAALMDVSEVTVYQWWHRYTEAGLAGVSAGCKST